MAKDWRQDASERQKDMASKGRFKLSEGDNVIRIIPRVGSSKSQAPFFEYKVHRDVGPNKRYMRCGKNRAGEGECWLCDEKIKTLADSDNQAKRKLAESLMPKDQFIVQVAYLDKDSNKMRGPVLWTVSTGGTKSLAYQLLGVLKDTKRDVTDVEDGYNLNIERTGTGMKDTRYSAISRDEESSKLPDRIMAAAKPFSALVPAYSEEQQKAAYFGRDADAVVDDEEEVKKKKPQEDDEESEEDTPKKKKKPVEEEEEPVEEDEETEAPKKKKKPSEDEEEEPESEEEEEEKPKAKKKKPAEEEEEETEPEEEEEEVERPKAKKKPAEEEEEEEEVEEKPKKKQKGRYEEEEESEEDADEKPKSKKGKKPVEEDEEESPKAKKKKPVDDDE